MIDREVTMASEALELVSAVLEAGNLNAVRKAGITAKKMVLASPEAALVYSAILEYSEDARHSGRVPTVQWIKKKYPQVELPPVTNDIHDLIDTVNGKYLAARMNTTLRSLNDLWKKEGPRSAIRALTSAALELTRDGEPSDDVIMELALKDVVMGEYDKIKTGSGKIGLSWPTTWKPLNNNTLGQCEGDYYVLYGLTKSMKTWAVEYILAEDYLNTDARIMIYIQEMKHEITLRRLALLLSKISSERYIKGQLTGEEETRLRITLEELEFNAKTDPKNSRLLIMAGGEAAGPATLRSKAKDWGARIIFADSAYLMSDDRTKTRGSNWQNIANISTDLRNLALQEHCTVFTTSQESERIGRQMGRHGTASVAYAHKLIEDAEIAFHIFKFKDPDLGEAELGFEFPASREYDIPAFTVHAVPAENFTFKKMGLRKEEAQENINVERFGRVPFNTQGYGNSLLLNPWNLGPTTEPTNEPE
jgi:replicative DNA helicase